MRRVRLMSPVGSPEDRLSMKIWPGAWFDATGFGRNTASGYTLGYHTGADLNLNVPVFNADRGMPFYPIWKGTVRYAGLGPGSWGWLVGIEHEPIDGRIYYTRSAHGRDIKVKVGQVVDVWDVLGYISNAEGHFADHFHVDLMEDDPFQWWHWPGWNLRWFEGTDQLYVDIKAFLSQEHLVEGEDNVPDIMIITADEGLDLRTDLPYKKGSEVIAKEQVVIGNTFYRRVEIWEGETKFEGWLVEKNAQGTYLIPKPAPAPIKEGFANVTAGLNVREGMGTNFPILRAIPFNEPMRYRETGIFATGFDWSALVDEPGFVATRLIRPK